MFEIKAKLPLRLTLLGSLLAVLIITLGIVSSASAYNFAFCYPKAGGAFEGGACRMKGSSHNDAYAAPAASNVLAFCEEQSGGAYHNAYCSETGSPNTWELKSSTTAVPKLNGTSSSTTLTITISGAKLEMTCNKDSMQMRPESGGATSEGTLELRSCTVTKPSDCSVKQPVVGSFTGDMEESVGKPLYKFKGSNERTTKEKEVLAEIEFEGEGCGLLNNVVVPVSGSQTCELDTHSGALLETHQLICKASGSSMKLGEWTVTYEGTTKVRAEGDYDWSPTGGTESVSESPSTHKIRYCHKIGSGEGGFANSTCSETGGSGEYAVAWPDSYLPNSLLACHKVTSGKGTYQNSSCTELGGSDSWEVEESAWPAKLVGSNGTVLLKGELSGAKTEITCAAGSLEANPTHEGESSEGEIKLSSCTVVKPEHCTVKGITMEFLGQLEESTGKLVDKLTGAGASETFAEITYEDGSSGMCALHGKTFALEGSQTSEWDANIGKYEEKQELIGKSSGSKMTLGGKKVTYEGTSTISAEGGEPWTAD